MRGDGKARIDRNQAILPFAETNGLQEYVKNRKSHVELLASKLADTLSNVITFVGGQPVKARKQLIEKLASVPGDQMFVIIATGNMSVRNLTNRGLTRCF